MGRCSKRMSSIKLETDAKKRWGIEDAINSLKKLSMVKFDETLTVSVLLNIDPKNPAHMVRGVVVLPYTSKSMSSTVCVIGKEDVVKEALSAGADFAGGDELIEKIKSGWVDMSVVLTTPDMMRQISVLGKVLGPRGLMPTPSTKTIVSNIPEAVRSFKKGQKSFKVDKQKTVYVSIGKLSDDSVGLAENTKEVLDVIFKSKPSSAKGAYINKVVLSSTMGPGMCLEVSNTGKY